MWISKFHQRCGSHELTGLCGLVDNHSCHETERVRTRSALIPEKKPIEEKTMTLHFPPPASGAYEAAVDNAIATCNGDLRGALKALIIANEFLERDLRHQRLHSIDIRDSTFPRRRLRSA
jgi:hypothetical protein